MLVQWACCLGYLSDSLTAKGWQNAKLHSGEVARGTRDWKPAGADEQWACFSFRHSWCRCPFLGMARMVYRCVAVNEDQICRSHWQQSQAQRGTGACSMAPPKNMGTLPILATICKNWSNASPVSIQWDYPRPHWDNIRVLQPSPLPCTWAWVVCIPGVPLPLLFSLHAENEGWNGRACLTCTRRLSLPPEVRSVSFGNWAFPSTSKPQNTCTEWHVQLYLLLLWTGVDISTLKTWTWHCQSQHVPVSLAFRWPSKQSMVMVAPLCTARLLCKG